MTEDLATPIEDADENLTAFLDSASDDESSIDEEGEEIVEIDPEDVVAATERIINRNPGCRRAMMETLDCCRELCSPSEIDRRVQAILENNRSVYSPEKMRTLLEGTGALIYIPSEEEQEARDRDGEPEVDEDGCLIMKLPEEGQWTLSEGGRLYLERHPFGEHLNVIKEKDANCLPVYRELLEFLEESPRDKASIDAAIDNHPLAQSPKRYSSYFLSQLEKGDAVEWTDAWQITDRGRELLEELRNSENSEN